MEWKKIAMPQIDRIFISEKITLPFLRPNKSDFISISMYRQWITRSIMSLEKVSCTLYAILKFISNKICSLIITNHFSETYKEGIAGKANFKFYNKMCFQ